MTETLIIISIIIFVPWHHILIHIHIWVLGSLSSLPLPNAILMTRTKGEHLSEIYCFDMCVLFAKSKFALIAAARISLARFAL